MPTVPLRLEVIEQSIPDRFNAIVALAPDSIAVRTRTCELSFARLDGWSNAVATNWSGAWVRRPNPSPFSCRRARWRSRRRWES